jgi:DNA polymerase II large subunit
LYNSIVTGDLENEFDTEVINNIDIVFDVQNSLLKTTYNTSDPSEFQNIIKNPSSGIFNDPLNGDFELFDQSVAKNAGNINFANQVPLDLKGKSRTPEPDLGVYEYIN